MNIKSNNNHSNTRLHILISGRVQGVFFRSETRSRARSLGLTGWVKNLPDGRVEIVAEGEKENCESLLRWARTGPPYASVTDIRVDREVPEDGFSDFRIAW